MSMARSMQSLFWICLASPLLTRKYGIVHYLSMVRRMQLTTEPIVKSYGGIHDQIRSG